MDGHEASHDANHEGTHEAGHDAGHGAGEHTDCAVVLGRMYEFLDAELPDADGDQIRQHLADCEPCLDQFDVEQAMKQLVGKCCRSEIAPETLRAKLEIGLLRVRGLST